MWIKISRREIGPISLVAYRVLFGLIFGLVVISLRRVKLPRDFRTWIPPLVMGITNFAAPFFLISWGERSVDSSVAAILDSTVPLFTIFIAHFMLSDDRMTKSRILGLLLGFAGVVVPLSKNIGVSHSAVLGQAAVVLAAICYACSGVYARRTTQNLPGILRSTGPLLSPSAIMWLAVFTTEHPVEVPSLRPRGLSSCLWASSDPAWPLQCHTISFTKSVRRAKVWLVYLPAWRGAARRHLPARTRDLTADRRRRFDRHQFCSCEPATNRKCHSRHRDIGRRKELRDERID